VADNPSPTQEVETRTLYICDRGHVDTSTLRGVCWQCFPGGRGGHPTQQAVEHVTLEDHQRLLQAEVERREEVEAQLITAEMRVEGLDVMRANLNRQKEAAESKLSSVVEELERRQERAEAVEAKGRMGGWMLGNAYGLGEAIVLLRDKGTEQGGDGSGVGAGTCGDRHEVSPERETGVVHPSAGTSASVDSGVAIESDSGLEDGGVEGDQRVVFEYHPECLEGENVREFHPEIVGAATGALRAMLDPEKDERAYRDADVLASCAVSEALKALVTVANLTQQNQNNQPPQGEGGGMKLLTAIAVVLLIGSAAFSTTSLLILAGWPANPYVTWQVLWSAAVLALVWKLKRAEIRQQGDGER
jgi:hypothetical protein